MVIVDIETTWSQGKKFNRSCEKVTYNRRVQTRKLYPLKDVDTTTMRACDRVLD